jgi:hypothetical protein
VAGGSRLDRPGSVIAARRGGERCWRAVNARCRARMLACVITACLTLPGCGLGTQTVPQPIDPASFTSAEPPAPPRSTSVGQIYLIRERRLVAVPRTTTTLTDTLSLLAAGPTPLDTETGLESPLRGAATVQAVDDAGVATIEVGPEFAGLPDDDRYLAVSLTKNSRSAADKPKACPGTLQHLGAFERDIDDRARVRMAPRCCCWSSSAVGTSTNTVRAIAKRFSRGLRPIVASTSPSGPRRWRRS